MLHKNVVPITALAIHADLNVMSLQGNDGCSAGELCTLVPIDDVKTTIVL